MKSKQIIMKLAQKNRFFVWCGETLRVQNIGACRGVRPPHQPNQGFCTRDFLLVIQCNKSKSIYRSGKGCSHFKFSNNKKRLIPFFIFFSFIRKYLWGNPNMIIAYSSNLHHSLSNYPFIHLFIHFSSNEFIHSSRYSSIHPSIEKI